MYVDADFASKATDRRSVSGALVIVAAMLVVWTFRTQKCVSQSTSEAEYLVMGDGVKKALPRDLFEVHRDFALGSR